MITRVLVASAALLILASTSMDANARRRGYHRAAYSNVTGRTRNYGPGLLGLRKQTRTGGPSGGQTTSGGGS